jgi:hypothetical protein
LNLKILTGDGRNTTESGGKTAQLWNVPMPLSDFLKSDKIEPLSPEQKKQYGIK